MKDFMHNFKYMLKSNLKSLDVLFWIVSYPIILSLLFYLSIGSIQHKKIDKLDVGIEENNPRLEYLKISNLFNFKYTTPETANKMIENKEINAFIDKDLNLLVNKNNVTNSLNINIIDSILSQFKEMENLQIPIEKYDFKVNYFTQSDSEMGAVKFHMYSLIAMYLIYGYFISINGYSIYQANLSTLGARISVTPLKKSIALLTPFTIGLLVNIVSNIILILFITYVYKINVINNVLVSSLVILSANIFGVSLGAIFSITNKFNIDFKNGIGISLSLLMSFLTGMMSNDVKNIVEDGFPLLAKINPIALSMDALYGLNVLKDVNLAIENSILLLATSVVIIGVSVLFMRRLKYESI